MKIDARKLKALRQQHGWTQEELAELLDVSPDAIGKYERSLSYIRGDLEPRLIERLGWSRDEVIACREDWEARQSGTGAARYRLLDGPTVDEVYGGSWAEASLASLRPLAKNSSPSRIRKRFLTWKRLRSASDSRTRKEV